MRTGKDNDNKLKKPERTNTQFAKFVMTNDKSSADNLISMGLKLINKNADTYIFLNDATKVVFNNISNVVYTNTIFL